MGTHRTDRIDIDDRHAYRRRSEWSGWSTDRPGEETTPIARQNVPDGPSRSITGLQAEVQTCPDER
jgi:hypothetical protein